MLLYIAIRDLINYLPTNKLNKLIEPLVENNMSKYF
jgi:hypothetical protein